MNAATSYRSWLPKGAVDAARVDRAFAESIQSWSGKWFARGKVRPLGPLAAGSAGPGTLDKGMQWHSLREGLALGVVDKATGALATSMLDANLGGTALTSGDRGLIEQITVACLDDLRGTLAAFFDIAADGRWRTDSEADLPPAKDAWTCALGLKDGEPLIRLIVQHNLVVAFRKSRISFPAASVDLRPLAEALEKQPVGVSARLGQCAMTLPDLAALNEGDVLVLDRTMDTPLELAIDGQVKLGRCVLEQEDERLLFRISKPLSG